MKTFGSEFTQNAVVERYAIISTPSALCDNSYSFITEYRFMKPPAVAVTVTSYDQNTDTFIIHIKGVACTIDALNLTLLVDHSDEPEMFVGETYTL